MTRPRFDVTCGDCGEVFWFHRDPAHEVPCPDCNAPIGAPCKKPSGYAFHRGTVHAKRDVRALEALAYGRHRAEGSCTVTHQFAVTRARARVGLRDESRIPSRVRRSA